ncbi:MAG: SipW-dependent-type signal peptide-containing protein [Clostridia bacterium]|nr:SipW-dependent-type signal peptide-containing protein [Clostridia bacterium]
MKLKSKKSALLMSFTSLLLCFAMLAGSTFAWFTDTATTGVNKIVSGKLKVDIVAEDGVTSLTGEGKELKFQNNANSNDILWEPGVTFLTQGFKIKNDGNLALKWKMTVNKENVANGKVGSEGTPSKSLLDVIDFYVVKSKDENAEAVKAEEFVGNLTKGAKSDVYYIKGVMQTTAGNDYQSLTLEGITITVYATQLNHENDSFGPDYDVTAPLDFVPVSNATELKNVFANAAAGGNVNVSLTDDIDLGADNTLMIVDENSNVGDINIQANGHTIKNAVAGARVLQIAKSTATRNITISGAKIVSEGAVTSSENRGVQIFSVDNATVNLVNCEIEMKANDYSYPVKIGGTSKNTTVNITGCTLTGANCIESFGTNCTVNITDCVLNSNYAPHETYCGNGIQDKNGTNNTYNIKNTTFNGTNAQPWQTSSTTVINDLGGNVYNTTRTTN